MKKILPGACLLALAIGALTFDGCQVFDPAEDVPSYIHIDSIGLSVNSNQGTASHNIPDAWVYVDGELLGGYEMPVNIPVLKEGTHTILVLAGIKQNGLSTTRAIYPEYRGWDTTVTLTRGQITQLGPIVVQYFPSTNFMWMCDFDQMGTTITDAGSNYPGQLHTISGSQAFEGSSGYVTLNADTLTFYAESSFTMSFNNGYDIYLEMNYSGTQPFSVGVKNVQSNNYIPWVQVTPEATWHKIYIHLNDAVSVDPSGGVFTVYIAAQKDANTSDSWLAIDEIKLIN